MMNDIIRNISLDAFTNGLSRQWGTYDYYVTDAFVHDLLLYFPTRHVNTYQLALCTSGYVRARVNGKEIKYEKNTFAAFVPSTVIEVIETSEDYRCRAVIFTRDFLLENYNNINFLERFRVINDKGLSYIKIDKEKVDGLIDTFVKIREKMQDKDHVFRRGIVRNLTLILLCEIENIFLNQNYENHEHLIYSRKENILADFQKLLKNHFRIERSVSFYASKLHISTKYLSEVLKEMIGKTAKEAINEIILTQAKVLLSTGKYNVSEVSTHLNYVNIEEFCRFFKKQSGMTPSQFRNLN